MLPRFTSGSPGPTFSGPQLAFAAISSIAVYGVFVFVQSVQHREAFLPVDLDGDIIDGESPGEDDPPATRAVALSVVLLTVSLAVVVGLAKSLSPSIEHGVSSMGAPQAVVGVMIALLVLLPESVASVRAAARDRMQISLNLALGSGLASIGLTIPTIAVASIWLDGPILLGLGEKEIVLLVLTAFVSIVSFDAGRATILQAALHLMIFAAFVFLAFNP